MGFKLRVEYRDVVAYISYFLASFKVFLLSTEIDATVYLNKTNKVREKIMISSAFIHWTIFILFCVLAFFSFDCFLFFSRLLLECVETRAHEAHLTL